MTALAFDAHGRCLAIGQKGGLSTVHDLADPARPPRTFRAEDPNAVTAVALDTRCRTPAASTAWGDYVVSLWNLERPSQPARVLRGHRGQVLSIVFSPDGDHLTTGSRDGTLRLWDLDASPPQSVLLSSYEDHSRPVFSPEGRWLYVKTRERIGQLHLVSGTTNVTTGGPGIPPPSGFKLGQPSVYYEITTTATYGGSITICIDYSGISFANENRLRLFHRKDSSWVDVTSSLDTINDIICGTVSSISPFAIFQENMTPAVGEITAPIALAPVNTSVTVSATFTDPDISDTHTATWDWDDGTSSAGTVTESGGSGSVVGSHSSSVHGVYLVTLSVTDNNSGAGSSIYQYVVVYDPYGGFVTGGGWIQSPQGAYTANPTLTGKANFGFVSKYKKGATVPTGVTEFQFQLANLNFHSDSYEWLVVAGAKAQYKGVGTINGEGQYKFVLMAIDADVSKTDGFLIDRFRIKIWTEGEDGIETRRRVARRPSRSPIVVAQV